MIPYLLFYKITQLLTVMLLGFAVVKLKILKSSDSGVLAKICLYILMPATIISSFDIDMTDDLKGGLALAFGVAIGLHLLFLVIDLLYKKLFGGNCTERASVMYSNAGNLIIPIVMFVLGDEWVVYSCAFLSVQLAFLWTHGIRLFSSEEKFNLKKILLNINIISIAIGAVLMICNLHLPTFVTDISSSLSGMIGNIGMLIAGMTMATVNVKKTVFNKRLYLVLFMRLIAIPAIALMLLKPLSMMIPLANVDKILLVSFLACMTPSAATVLQFAQIHNKDADFAASVNVVSTIASIVTMPIFVALYCM